MDSYNNKEKLKEDLVKLSNDIDVIYSDLYKEIKEELYGKMRKQYNIEQDIQDLYFNHLEDEDALILVKSKLPLMVKLFNKVKYLGMGISNTGREINIHFVFNDNTYGKSFYCSFTSGEIKKVIKRLKGYDNENVRGTK